MSTIATLSVIGILHFFLSRNQQYRKRMISITLSTVLLLTCFAGCSSKPSSGNITFHNHQIETFATCTTGAYCSCGKMIEAPLGHSYRAATCKVPQTCSRCGYQVGDIGEHNYHNGECINCGLPDANYIPPKNYIDPNNYGFINNYGMTMWIDISGYDLSNAEAYYKESKYSSDHNHLYRDFKNGVMYGYEHKKGTSKQDLGGTFPYQVLNNDSLTVSGTTITIVERVSDKNGNLIIKAMVTYTHYGTTESEEYWFILADQVDWEKSPEVSGDKEIFYFK